MAIWIRPSGSEIELADTDNLNQFAKDQGWTKKEDKPKRTRRTKAQMAEDNGNGFTNS